MRQHNIIANYPLSRLVASVLFPTRLKRSDFVTSLGYLNIHRGLRSLDSMLYEGIPNPYILQQLATVYQFDRQQLAEALRCNEVQRRAEAVAKEAARRAKEEAGDRHTFRPHVVVETSLSTPTSITIVACMGASMKFIRFNNLRDHNGVPFFELLETQQLPLVQQVVRAHFIEHKGQCQFFGRITGYRYRQTYDLNLYLDINGEFIRASEDHKPSPHTSLSVDGKVISTVEHPFLRNCTSHKEDSSEP